MPSNFTILFRLFLRAAAMSTMQSAGVVLLAQYSLAAVVTSSLIAWNWIGASRDSVDYRLPWSRFWYGAGGGAGAALVLAAARWL